VKIRKKASRKRVKNKQVQAETSQNLTVQAWSCANASTPSLIPVVGTKTAELQIEQSKHQHVAVSLTFAIGVNTPQQYAS